MLISLFQAPCLPFTFASSPLSESLEQARCLSPGFARARIGICFKIGAEGSFEVAAQGKGCFLCPTYRIWQKPYLTDVCSCKEFFKFRATADRHCYLACVKKGRSEDNTRLLPHAKILLVPMNCFLCRIDYVLEENILIEQM